MLSTSLANGLRVIVDDSSPTDVAAVYLWINVGSADEPEGLYGAAHFVEHMVFKGTASYGVGEVAAAIEDAGGDLNAFTSFDETVFHASVPGAAAPGAVAVLAEMLQSARMDPTELMREREVVVEEIRGGDDDPGMVVSEAVHAAAFGPHPYGRPIIGTADSVRKMPRDALLAFYRAWYQPANACLTVVGKVDRDAILAAASTFLGGGSRPPARIVRSAPARVRRQETLRRGFDTALVEVAWPAPPFGHADVPALDILVTALGGGASSPIEARLRLAEGHCLGTGMHLEVERDAGLIVAGLHVREDRVGPALAGLAEEVARAGAGDIGFADLERARAQILSEQVFGRETVDGRAHNLAWYRERAGDADGGRAYEAAVAAVDTAAVVRAARTWLDADLRTTVALLPTGAAAPRATRRSPVVQRARAEERRFTLPNGVRILLVPDHGDVAAMRIAGLGGSLFETARVAGIGSAWARAAIRGAGRRRALGYAAAVEALAGGVGAVAGRSSQNIRGEFTRRTFAQGLDLVLDLLLSPRFDDGEVESVRREQLDALAERDDHPGEELAELLAGLTFPGHAWALPVLGTRASVARLQPARLADFHGRWAVGGNLVVAVTGGFDADTIERTLTDALSGLPAGTVDRPRGPPTWGPPRRDQRRLGREQAHLACAFRGIPIGDPQAGAMEVLVGALGGQSGRLFMELREMWGLAYSVSASMEEGLDRGLVVCALATDPARADEGEERLLQSLARVAREGISDIEFARSRQCLLGGLDHDLQTASARARHLAYGELYGLGADVDGAQIRRRLLAVRPEDVQAMAAATLAEPVAIARVLPRAGAG